jgi:magnesium-protoporphyrin O-methyltransferase
MYSLLIAAADDTVQDVAGCCSSDYRRFFNRKFAARDLKRYRSDGLSATERDLVTLCGKVEGASVLEVGGGIGALQLELLHAGATAATNIELSGAYEEAAAELFDGARAERLIGDFVAVDVPPADVVLLHRVVCCYPDADAMVGKAAAHALHRLALTLPQQRPWIGWGLGLVNLWLRLSRCGFRTYHHPFDRIAAAAAAEGLRLAGRVRRGLVWESAVFER